MVFKHVAPSTDNVDKCLPERPNIYLKERAENLIRLNCLNLGMKRLVAIDHFSESFNCWCAMFWRWRILVCYQINLVGILKEVKISFGRSLNWLQTKNSSIVQEKFHAIFSILKPKIRVALKIAAKLSRFFQSFINAQQNLLLHFLNISFVWNQILVRFFGAFVQSWN